MILNKKFLVRERSLSVFKKQTDREKGPEQGGSESMMVPIPTEDEDIEVRENPENDGNVSYLNAFHPNDIGSGRYIHGQVNIGFRGGRNRFKTDRTEPKRTGVSLTRTKNKQHSNAHTNKHTHKTLYIS